MPFLPCYLCDALRGAEPCGVLIENRAWFAVHAPAHDCVPRLILIAPKRHVTTNRVRPDEVSLLIGLQQTIAQVLGDVTDGQPIARRSELARFGHLCWMVWPAAAANTPRTAILKELGDYPPPEVLRWSREVETALDPARIRAAGDRLPPPPPLPVAHMDGPSASGLLRVVNVRFCRHCGAGVKRVDYANNACPACAQPVR